MFLHFLQATLNPEICKSQREITMFLLFWSGKSLFSCFFWLATTLEPGNPKCDLQISGFRGSSPPKKARK